MPTSERPSLTENSKILQAKLYKRLLPEVKLLLTSVSQSYPYVARYELEEAGMNALIKGIVEDGTESEDAIFTACYDAMIACVNKGVTELLYAQQERARAVPQDISAMRGEIVQRAYMVLFSEALLSPEQKVLVLEHCFGDEKELDPSKSAQLKTALELIHKAIHDPRYMALCKEKMNKKGRREPKPTIH